MLLQPTQLHTTLKSWYGYVTLNYASTSNCIPSDWTRNTLNSLQNYEVEVRRNSRLALLQCQEERSRLEQLTGLLYQSIFSVNSILSFDPHQS